MFVDELKKDSYEIAADALKERLNMLYSMALSVQERHWGFIYKVENTMSGWENKSRLQLLISYKGNNLRVAWVGINWIGSKANGDRRSVKKNISKPKGESSYSLKSLMNYARDWEMEAVKNAEKELAAIRLEATHLVKTITTMRYAVLARDGKLSSKISKLKTSSEE
jgi:hypothetical protein